MSDTPLYIPKLIERKKFTDYRQPIWGDSFNWHWERTTKEIRYLVIHHSVTKHEATPDDIALLHKARGWGGIGYHFVITKDGHVYYVGDVGTARANVGGLNEKVIGILLVGDFTRHLPSDEQILSAHDLCKFFLDQTPVWPNLTTWEEVMVGHKELNATACPGADWKETASSLFNRIRGRIPYTPQPPTPEPTDPKPPKPEPVPEPVEPPPTGPTPLQACEASRDELKKKLEAAEKKDYEKQTTGVLIAQALKNLTGNN